ncbi:P68 family surface lipoprotein [Mycoplasmoides genitalium]
MKLKGFLAVGVSVFGFSGLLMACSVVSQFDQVDDGKIKLASSLTSKRTAEALETVVKKYNDTKDPGDYPIEIVQIAGGYDGGKKDVQTKVSTKDKNNFYNLILNYPEIVSTLSRSKMALNFDGVNVDKLHPNFLSFNSRIGGIRDDGIYAIPISMSTDLMVINGPVLHYILNSARKEGTPTSTTVQATVSSRSAEKKGTLEIANDSETTKLWQNIQTTAQNNSNETTKEQKQVKRSSSSSSTTSTTGETKDTTKSDNKIKEFWGEYQEVDGGLKNFTFKASIFENWNETLDFATRIANSFPEKVKNITNKTGLDLQGVLGVDSSSNALYAAVFAAGQANYDNFFFNIDKRTGYADYSNFLNKDSSYQNLESVYNDFYKLIQANGLFVNRGGFYSSNFEKFHQLAFSVSSSGGYSYYFAKDNAKRLKFSNYAIEYPSFTQTIQAPNSSETESNLLGTFKLSEKDINLYKGSIPSGKQQGVNAILISNPNLINILEQAKQKNTAQGSESTTNKIIGYTTTANVNVDNQNIFSVSKLNNEQFQRKIIVNATEETLDQSQTLQSNESIVLPMPGKYKSTDKNKVMITQGPNLIGIHANEKENIETKKFVNWFLNQSITDWNSNNQQKNSDQTTKTAAEYFTDQASYILPLKEKFNKSSDLELKGSSSSSNLTTSSASASLLISNNSSTASSPAPKKTNNNSNTFTAKALELFQQAANNEIIPFSDPSDFRNGTFRNNISSSFNAAVNSKVSFNQFVQNFINSLGSGFRR